MLQLAMAKVAVTPDGRGAVGFLPVPAPQAPRDELFARLFLLGDGTEYALIVALDYGGLYLSAGAEWKVRLARAAGVPENRTLIHCIHQHDAPFVNIEAGRRIAPETDWSWLEPIVARLEQAAAKLPEQLRPVGRIGWSETRLHGYASNRRVPMADGSIAVRYSRCSDPAIKAMPVGIIDPMLRTLGFYGSDGELLASWSFYATHPQVANEGKRYSADAPGEAMRLLEERFPGAAHAFFNGCFGNVTAGKYTSTTDLEGNLRRFGRLLADGIERNIAAPEFMDAAAPCWRRGAFPFPAREFDEIELARRAEHSPLIRAALEAGAMWAQAHSEEFIIDLLRIGPVRLLFMDGELFIEYQLFCQSLIPDEKMAVIGNCGGNFYYIGTAEALSDPAGYETTGFCRVKPEFEALFQQTVRQLFQ
ncbi:hypothetical protein SDC9_98812 [bioreactor metagenome]|uniref:Uncharacterized protein n=1 Tax=bioreactor metagenome TaxID=1076179 RepID=A0A645AFV1_9ZZZZ